MNKICKGCGVILQGQEKEHLGYTPKQDSEYCQRCFRLTHYNDVVISMQQDIDNDVLLSKINKLDALILWVVDVLDFEASLFKGLNRHFLGKDILLVLTKSDLLPRNAPMDKMQRFIIKRLKQENIEVTHILMVPNMHKQDEASIELIKQEMEVDRGSRDVCLFGSANAGKSTLLNALLANHDLTTSAHPGTTIDLNPIPYEGYTLYDTPGAVNENSVLTHLEVKDLADVVLMKQLNPTKYQLRGDQTLSIGGLARIDLFGCDKVSVICYVSSALNIHRSKQEGADLLWDIHMGQDILIPSLDLKRDTMKVYQANKKFDKMDIAIAGLGWVCIHGDLKEVKVYVNNKIDVVFREAMI